MIETTSVNSGNYISMKRLYDSCEVNDGKFGCNIEKIQNVS